MTHPSNYCHFILWKQQVLIKVSWACQHITNGRQELVVLAVRVTQLGMNIISAATTINHFQSEIGVI